jgi:hypothetical protein
VKKNRDGCEQLAAGESNVSGDSDMLPAERALWRALDSARQEARRFGHGIMIWRDGKVVEEGKDCPAND